MIRISAHRFAEKMRKRMTTSIAAVFLTIGGFAQGMADLGIETRPLSDTGGISMCGGYGFSRRWAASFSAGISVPGAGRKPDKEYEEHLAEFEEFPYGRQKPESSFSLTVVYWPQGTYEGFFIGTGCRYTVGSYPAYLIDIGYRMPVWKGLALVLSYGNEGLGMGIRWMIKTGKT